MANTPSAFTVANNSTRACARGKSRERDWQSASMAFISPGIHNLDRVHRLKSLGNSIVPQVVLEITEAIKKPEKCGETYGSLRLQLPGLFILGQKPHQPNDIAMNARESDILVNDEILFLGVRVRHVPNCPQSAREVNVVQAKSEKIARNVFEAAPLRLFFKDVVRDPRKSNGYPFGAQKVVPQLSALRESVQVISPTPR
jgi:hypothetical protein